MAETCLNTTNSEILDTLVRTPLDLARGDYAQANFDDALGFDSPSNNEVTTQEAAEIYRRLVINGALTSVQETLDAITDDSGNVDLQASVPDYRLFVIDELSRKLGLFTSEEREKRLKHYEGELKARSKFTDTLDDDIYKLFDTSDKACETTTKDEVNTSEEYSAKAIEDILKVNVALIWFVNETGTVVTRDKLTAKISSIVHTYAGVTDPYSEFLWLRGDVKRAGLVDKAKKSGMFRGLFRRS